MSAYGTPLSQVSGQRPQCFEFVIRLQYYRVFKFDTLDAITGSITC
jgi:hypothetical protein